MDSAVLYIRSSKDRAEVGLVAQRQELRAFAKAKGLKVADEFSDMEISGSLDETARPGLRDLLLALKEPERKWASILALDTSRIARDPMLALYVTAEAEKHGARIEYAKMPVDGSSAFGETMLSVVRAFDRLHSRLSRDKGVAGLEANLAKGFRAGGAAPFGYTLQRHETGGHRDGKPVSKSTLVLDPKPARQVKVFLTARSDGVPRAEAASRAKLEKHVASLIAIERNALTYAGYQCWNMRRKIKPTREDPRKTMQWRPRSEWIISEEPVHEALVTREEAERILAMHADRRPKPRVVAPDRFLLSGLMFTFEGQQWTGDAHDNAYRVRKGKRVSASWIEEDVILQLAKDFKDPKFLTRVINEARRMADSIEADPLELDGGIRKLERQLGNLVSLAAEAGDKAILVRIRETEAKLSELQEQKADWAARAVLKRQLQAIEEKDVKELLAWTSLDTAMGFDNELIDLRGETQKLDRGQTRRVLTTLIERVELDPATRKFLIHYKLPLTGARVASPRGFEPLLQP